MRCYCIDELAKNDMQRLTARLDAMALSAGLPDVYWLPVPPALLTPDQKGHEDHCGPYAMALEIEPESLRLELLVRARGKLHCECISYAGPELVRHMIDYVDTLLAELGIAA